MLIDNYGYFDDQPHYIVGDQRYYNVINAWKAVHETKREFRFYFYEREYDRHDWTVEPTESWEDLCKNRALQLRQRYKRLSLYYTAGRDSDHILNVFEANSIPLDELILISLPYWPQREFELENYILPRAKEFVARHPETKIKMQVHDKSLYDIYYTKDWAETHGLKGTKFIPGYMPWFTQHLGDFKDRHGYILGVDKPRIMLEDGKYYTSILDKVTEHFASNVDNVELFYYAPSMPLLHIKQTWMVLNYLEKTFTPDQLTPEFINEFCADPHSPYYHDFCIACGRGPGWNPSLGIQNGLAKTKLGGRDPVFLELTKKTKEYGWAATNYYLNFLDDRAKDMTYAFNKGDPKLGTVGIWGKKYFLKNAKTVNS